jgi:predicted dehydrogenase
MYAMPQTNLRGALIGCGFFAENHLHAWSEVKGVSMVALCDRDREKAAAAGQRHGIDRLYEDAEAMLATEKPDFVDIATTVQSHRPLVELAARHKVPVICQKPFAASLADAQAMVDACEKAGIPLMVHENFRWQTPIMAVSEVIRSGVIGKPYFGRISFRHDFNIYEKQPYLATDERFVILDLGIHLIDVARFLFGEVETLAARTKTINPLVRGEDTATLLLDHVDGATSVIDTSFFAHRQPNPFPQTFVEVDGDKGSVLLAQDFVMRVTTPQGATVHSVAPVARPWHSSPFEVIQDSVFNIESHWAECLRGGRQPDTSGADNIRTLTLALAAYEAAAGKQSLHFGK